MAGRSGEWSQGNPVTTVQFDLPQQAHVRLDLFDILGRRVLSVPEQVLPAGTLRGVRVDAASLATGLYLYQVASNDDVRRQRTDGTPKVEGLSSDALRSKGLSAGQKNQRIVLHLHQTNLPQQGTGGAQSSQDATLQGSRLSEAEAQSVL